MPDTRARYFTSQPSLPASRPVRADERVGRMLGCSADHAQRLRTSIIPEAITAILAACHDDPGKAEAFRRHCLTALSAEPSPDLTPDLILAAATEDAEENVAAMAATVGGMTDQERVAWIRRLRGELGAKSNLVRALEAK